MQGVIVTPERRRLGAGRREEPARLLPEGRLDQGPDLCEGDSAEPCKSFKVPFHLGIDQQDRIWVTNAVGDFVIRFPASDPSKVEKFKTGYSGSGLGIDSQGNVWVTNRFGSGLHGLERMAEGRHRRAATAATFDRTLVYTMFDQKGGPDGGSVTLLPARRHAVSRLALHGRRPARSVGRDGRRRRHRLDLELRRARTVGSRTCAASRPRTARPA